MTEELKKLCNKNGKLPAWAWPGGYPLMYLDSGNFVLCAECASKDDSAAERVTYTLYFEGPTIYCEYCNTDIQSAYGDPEEKVEFPDPEMEEYLEPADENDKSFHSKPVKKENV